MIPVKTHPITRIIGIVIIVGIVIVLFKERKLPASESWAPPSTLSPTHRLSPTANTRVRTPPRPRVGSSSGRCSSPISLSIGQVDEQFNVSIDTLRGALESAVHEWNTATGRALFVSREPGEVSVNLLFDGRQDSINQLAAEEREIAALSEDLKARVANHEAAANRIKGAVTSWRQETESHNKRVEDMNAITAAGVESSYDQAALQDELHRITQRGAQLEESKRSLMLESDLLNRDAVTLNEERDALNARIQSVHDRFPPTIFTQGEHRRGLAVNEINIYTFYDIEEFRVVLLHEMGHALGLPHTDERPAIMYPVIEHGSDLSNLTPSDVRAALAICAE